MIFSRISWYAIAATLGINGETNLQALLSLDYNGNAITFGNKIIGEMEKYGLKKMKDQLLLIV